MDIYTIALYLHRIGALGLFITVGLEWVILWRTRRAATAWQARKGIQLSNTVRRFSAPFMVALLVSGVYMTVTVWGPVPWILVALGTLLLLSILLSKLAGSSQAAVQQALADDNGLQSDALLVAIRRPILWVMMQIRAAITLGVVFLMVMKPGLVESLLAIIASTILGLILSIPTFIHTRAQQQANPRSS